VASSHTPRPATRFLDGHSTVLYLRCHSQTDRKFATHGFETLERRVHMLTQLDDVCSTLWHTRI
jgi:hypothetical protein